MKEFQIRNANSTYIELCRTHQLFIEKFTQMAENIAAIKRLNSDGTKFEVFGKCFELDFSMVRNPLEKTHVPFLGQNSAYSLTECEGDFRERSYPNPDWVG